MDIEIIHEPTEKEPFIVLYKPSLLPSAPLEPGDDSALTRALKLFPEAAVVKGKKEVEHGLLHRIDNHTSGLLLIATEQNFYDYMWEQQNEGKFVKDYIAICKNEPVTDESYPPFRLKMMADGDFDIENVLRCTKKYTISSRFRPFGEKSRLVRPVTEDSGKFVLKKAGRTEYSTEVNLFNRPDGSILASCSLSKGYRHQVRVHLAWSGHPIAGDPLYCTTIGDGEDFCFCAYGFSFHDRDGEEIRFERKPEWLMS